VSMDYENKAQWDMSTEGMTNPFDEIEVDPAADSDEETPAKDRSNSLAFAPAIVIE